ncbi:MAG: hypothetical protein ABI557_15505 [Aureliella sp.]
MKSERRHELQKNELADRLAGGIESTRSFLPAILGGLVILAIGAIGWGLYSGYSKSQASAAWTEFYFNLTGGEASSFVDLADDHPGSAAAGWARQFAGDNYLQRGIGSMYSNRVEAKELLGKAIDAFEEVDQAASNSELRSKALLGLAQAHETLGETDKAASYYQQLAKIATQPGLVSEANQRLAFVTSDSGKSFYSWFSQLDPKPDAPIKLPSDMLLPPTTPDLQFGPSDTELNSLLGPAVTNPPGAPAEPQVPLDTSSAPDLPAGGSVLVLQPTEEAAAPTADVEKPAAGELELPASGETPATTDEEAKP